jgi:hypothetical protein
MKYLKIFENFEELDYDLIRDELKEHGWGDLSPQYYEDFEKSSYYSGTKDSIEYSKEMDYYMHDLSTGDENDEYDIQDVVDFIKPSNPMDSEEYYYYCFGDDEVYYRDCSLKEYMDAIESSVFVENSDASDKFGWNFIKSNKQEILDACREDLLSSDIDFIDEDEADDFRQADEIAKKFIYKSSDDSLDLSIELENKLRNLEDDSEYTFDDFFDEFGVDPEYRSDFVLASILNKMQKYKEMSNEEFKRVYDEYKKIK